MTDDHAAAQREPESVSFSSLSTGGEMSKIFNETDWSQTPLGPVSSWSPTLKMMVRLLLANRFPLLIWWGPQFCQLYNDAYRPILGTKHPKSLGQPGNECWPEIWDIIGPLAETPFKGGPPSWMEDILLELNRHGFVEETHFTIAYSPVPDDSVPSGIGGVLATVHEITEKIIGERRVVILRDLGAHAVEAKTAEEACTLAAKTLVNHPRDVPFALIYLMDADGKRAHLACAAGVNEGTSISPRLIEFASECGDASWELNEVVRTEMPHVINDLATRFGADVPAGPWDDPPHQAVVSPIRSNIAHQLAGFFVAGLSPRSRFDNSYQSFVELAVSQIATAIANARAYEEERRRAEALAELDRVKTAFFSNVSHEFRTPLTLMLGPLEETLTKENGQLTATSREQIELAHRNGLRLLKLVNTLLDFSRIEAGRAQAVYEPTDLSNYTSELASVFRSAIERAGLQLVVNCPPLSEQLYVDRDMWEKIVLNLLSNAFKFTFAGEIEISLQETADAVELRVRDTGVGIAADQLQHVFKRFHRLKNTRGRTHEGSGIGLALVQELAKLHGGTVKVSSQLDHGSTFVVSIPKGRAHLPANQIESARDFFSNSRGNTFVEEALRWLPGNGGSIATLKDPESLTLNSESSLNQPSPAEQRSRIILADDNADMRDYVARLLGEQHEVESVTDGEAALEAARQATPDLIVSDVMMPKLGGFELLRELRSDPNLKTVPVILLSARAGEESKVEGLEAGADDYLIKPFSARELLARVGARLEISRLRREADAALRANQSQLKESERLQRLLAQVGELGSSAATASELIEAIGECVAKEFSVARCGFSLVDVGRDLITVVSDYHPDLPSLAGEYSIAIHADYWKDDALEGRAVVLDDVATDPRTKDRYERAFAPMGTRAHLTVPLQRDGKWVANFWINHNEPRHWTKAETELMRLVAERVWAIVERKRAEEEREALLETEKELRQVAEEANRLKDEFLAIMSHELRNPLNVMLGYSELLVRSDEIGRSPHLKKMAEAIKRNAKAQSKLIRDLLDLSRLRSGKLELNREIVSIMMSVNNAIDTVRADADAKQIVIKVSAAKEALFVNGDSVRLEQILWNLLNNAIKFTPNRGAISVRLTSDDNDLSLEITDTGEGIAADFLPHVFELFRQADASTSRVQSGMGVGLAIVKQLVDLHNGSIAASSDGPGKGATFTVKLPLSQEATSTLDGNGDATTDLGGMSILVVDDSPETVEMLVHLLDESGAHVLSATSGEEALRIARGNRFDAVLSDISMPGMDGFEFARKFRQLPGKKTVPILALTGFGRAEDIERAKTEGFFSHLTKPIDIDALAKLLKNVRKN